MPNISHALSKFFKSALPSPLGIALLLTVFTFLLAAITQQQSITSLTTNITALASYWEKGLWGMDLQNGVWVRSWQLPFLV
ncbi:MAG: hypothetical protein R3279_13230, partial [Putridiphycobacter sp.]|nr:hypothetical protein [Putridiphycobacter sp.]